MNLRLKIALLLASVFAFAQPSKPDWSKWWPQFQSAVAKHDAKAVADMTFVPTQWELGKMHRLESRTVFVQKFDTYFPDHMRQAVATQKPESFPDGSYVVSWSHGVEDYALFFKPDGKGGYRLDSLARNNM